MNTAVRNLKAYVLLKTDKMNVGDGTKGSYKIIKT